MKTFTGLAALLAISSGVAVANGAQQNNKSSDSSLVEPEKPTTKRVILYDSEGNPVIVELQNEEQLDENSIPKILKKTPSPITDVCPGGDCGCAENIHDLQ